METTFSRWLRENDTPPYRFARERKLHYRAIYRLAGVQTDRPEAHFTSSLLAAVSRITGISVDRLLSEAEAARADPTPSRKYERKGGGDAAAD